MSWCCSCSSCSSIMKIFLVLINWAHWMRKSHEVLLEKIYWFSSYEPKTLGGGLRGPPPWLLGLKTKSYWINFIFYILIFYYIHYILYFSVPPFYLCFHKVHCKRKSTWQWLMWGEIEDEWMITFIHNKYINLQYKLQSVIHTRLCEIESTGKNDSFKSHLSRRNSKRCIGPPSIRPSLDPFVRLSIRPSVGQ